MRNLYVFLICFFLNSGFAQSNGLTSLQGDIYINLGFVKVGEDHGSYPLERLIHKIKPQVNEAFAGQSIHFVFAPTREYLGQPESLVEDWKNYQLPVFDEQLTIYIYPGSESGPDHTYTFTNVSSEIALVPIYGEEEFTQLLIKNLLYMLGIPLAEFNAKEAFVYNDFGFEEISSLLDKPRKKRVLSRKKKENEPVITFWGGDQVPGEESLVSPGQGSQIRKNLVQMAHLKNKLFTLAPRVHSSAQLAGAHTVMAP